MPKSGRPKAHQEVGATRETGSARDAGSRAAFVAATAELIRRQGYSATGINEIVERSGAPRGSLYFHFPGGKEELAVAAMTSAGEQLRRAISALLGSAEDVGAGVAKLIDALAAGLASSDYEQGCPIATVTLEAATGSPAIGATADAVFASWLGVLEERLLAAGLESPRAQRLALLVLSAVEGALVLARARHDLAPLVAVRDELVQLLSNGA
jgi:TetR/AcrR family transcriptional repressor of lmrAB and yxaGH operons